MKTKKLLLILLSFVNGPVCIMLVSTITAEGLSTTTICDVPSAGHPTIQSAVDDVGCDVVNLTSSLYIENVTIGRSVTVQGLGKDISIVDGNDSGRVFEIQSGLVVTLSDMTIRNGTAIVIPDAQGGGIRIFGSTLTIVDVKISDNYAQIGGGLYSEYSDLIIKNSELISNSSNLSGGGLAAFFGFTTIINSHIENNTAVSGNGGGFYSSGPATLVRSTVAGNSANYGGGIYGIALTVTKSLLSGNSASGGGALFTVFGSIELRNSTVSYNTAGIGGGANVSTVGKLNIINSTFIENAANGFGGGVAIENGSVSASNSIIANSLNGGDCNAPITSLGYNIDSDNSCGLTAVGDQPNVDPLLGPLQDNGGPTWTHALLPGSPALDTGNPNTPGSSGACEAYDQRGFIRPQDGDGDGITRCDIGAFEKLSPNAGFIYLPAVFRSP